MRLHFYVNQIEVYIPMKKLRKGTMEFLYMQQENDLF